MAYRPEHRKRECSQSLADLTERAKREEYLLNLDSNWPVGDVRVGWLDREPLLLQRLVGGCTDALPVPAAGDTVSWIGNDESVDRFF